MPHPKKRTPSARRDRRRSHHALKATQIATCESCSADILPHHACASCGSYKGKKVVEGTAVKEAKRSERKAERKKHDEEAAKEALAPEESKKAEKSEKEEKKDK